MTLVLTHALSVVIQLYSKDTNTGFICGRLWVCGLWIAFYDWRASAIATSMSAPEESNPR